MTSTQTKLFRILDGNLDRAREGLRVIEDWCRFGLDNAELTSECKDLRQAIAQWHAPAFRVARNTGADVGTDLTHTHELEKANLDSVLVANFSRVQEALRVLEEYSKLHDARMSQACKQFRYRVYALQTAMIIETRPLDRLLQARLYLVTSPSETLLETVEQALQGGLKLVQYRDKDAPDCDRLQRAIQLREVCHRYGALFIVNDRVDLAYAAQADGVHLGQQDVPMTVARDILGPDKIVGRSTTNPQEMARAIAEKADYIGVGPIFETPTKQGKAAVGFDYIRYALEHAPMPWYAIGGINLDNLPQVLQAGAERVALVRAIMAAPDPKATTQALLTLL